MNINQLIRQKYFPVAVNHKVRGSGPPSSAINVNKKINPVSKQDKRC